MLRSLAGPASSRLFHSSPRVFHLVGPPDPVSNLRHVLYDDPPQPPEARHPYSLREFRGDTRDTYDYDLHWRLQRQQLDTFNHNFWTDSNARFEAAKQDVLAGLPESSSSLDREQALSDFYKHWLVQETRQQSAYTHEWRRRNVEGITLAARVEYRKFKARISTALTRN